MKYFFGLLFVLAILATTTSEATPSSIPPPSASQPSYPPQENSGGYVPHATYPYSQIYPDTYDGYVVPAGSVQYGDSAMSVLPSSQTLVQVALKLFAKVGLFLLGGVALLFVGGVFTTAVCSLTPICTITFAGFQGINKETMRSYVTPDRISAAASFLQDAVGKYQHLQRKTGNY